MDFQNPMARRTCRGALAQLDRIAVAYRESSLGTRVFLVGKVSNKMSGSAITEFPASLCGKFAHKVIQRSCRKLRISEIELFTFAKADQDK
jgi:hypothetical protein